MNNINVTQRSITAMVKTRDFRVYPKLFWRLKYSIISLVVMPSIFNTISYLYITPPPHSPTGKKLILRHKLSELWQGRGVISGWQDRNLL